MFEVWVCGEFYMNFFEDLFYKFFQLVNFFILEELNCGFYCFLEWWNVMIVEGYFVYVIDKWCVDFLLMLWDNFLLCDVDVIIDFSFSFLQFVVFVFQFIK